MLIVNKKTLTADELGENIRQQLILVVNHGEPIKGMRRDLKLLQMKLRCPNPSDRPLILNPDCLDKFMKPRLRFDEVWELTGLLHAWRKS